MKNAAVLLLFLSLVGGFAWVIYLNATEAPADVPTSHHVVR